MTATPRVVRPPLPANAAAIVRIATIVALLSAWLLFFALALSGLQATRSQELAYEQLRERLALATVPIGGSIVPGTPVALLEAPRLGLRTVVIETTTADALRAGPGHRGDTPLPGQAGVSVVYGRSVTFGGPFRLVPQLRRGDVITVTTGQGTFDYRVDGVRRPGDAMPDPVRSGSGRLTLVTAEGSNWRSGWAPDRVVYVDASLQGRAQPAPAGRPSTVSGQEKAMRGDPDALVAVVLWLQVLVAAAGAGTWAQVRWGGAQAWLVFVPVIMAALWGASDSALRLLPNLI